MSFEAAEEMRFHNSQRLSETMYFNNFCLDDEGNVFMRNNNILCQVTKNGK